MKYRFKINARMLFYFWGTAVLVFIIALGYTSIKIRNIFIEDSNENIENISLKLTEDTKSNFDAYMQVASVVAQSFSSYEKIAEEERREFFSQILQDILYRNSEILSAWSIWEPLSIDKSDSNNIKKQGSTVLGNFNPVYYKENDTLKLSSYVEQDSNKVFSHKAYVTVKNTASNLVMDPYDNQYMKNITSKVLQTDMVVPIISKGKFLGVVGIKIPIDKIQAKIASMNHVEGGVPCIITNNGNILSHPDSSFLGKSFNSYAPNIEKKFSVVERIINGETFAFNTNDPVSGEKSLFVLTPFYIGSCKEAWSFCFSIPHSVVYKEANKTLKQTIIICALGLLILSTIIVLVSFSISKPLARMTKNLQLIAEGNISDVHTGSFLFKDEISEMADATDDLVLGLKSAADFAQEIGKGNLDATYKLLSRDDMLGNSLIDMQNRLRYSKKQKEQKRYEDEKINWVTNGLASFGEIIRKDSDDIKKFAINIVDSLMTYTNAAQIALYISKKIDNELLEDDLYELKAAKAYGKTIMINKTFAVGEGLLGRSVDESRTIYLEKLPDNYAEMSEGIQTKKRPRFLLIVPLSVGSIVLGVFELLFFDKVPSHYIEFVEKLSENIASVISSVKTKTNTTKLLERSKKQADELAQHEEEMRQNLEEIQATEEEAEKRYKDLLNHIMALNNELIFAGLDVEGKVVSMSKLMQSVYGVNSNKIKGECYNTLISSYVDTKDSFDNFFASVVSNGMGRREHRISSQEGGYILVEENYKVMENPKAPFKVVVIVTPLGDVQENKV